METMTAPDWAKYEKVNCREQFCNDGVSFIDFPCPSAADKRYEREEEDSRIYG